MGGDDLWGLQVTEFGGPVTGGLRVLRVLNGPQQAASGGDGRIFGEPKSCQIGDAKLSFKEPPGFIHPTGPRRDGSRMDSQKSQRRDVRIFIGGNRKQQLLDAQASSYGWGLFSFTRVKFKASGRDVGNGEVGPRMQTEKIVAPRIKQSFIGDRPRGQDPGDATFDHALRFFGIF